MEWIQIFLIGLLLYAKTDIFRRIACKPDSELTEKQQISSWWVACIPGIFQIVITVPMSMFGIILGASMANQPIHSTYQQMVITGILEFPLWFVWGLNMMLIPLAFSILRVLKVSRPFPRMIAAYFAVTALEYVFVISSLMMTGAKI